MDIQYVFDPGIVPEPPDKDAPDPILPVRNRFGEKRMGIVKSSDTDKHDQRFWIVEMGGEKYHVYLSYDVWEPNG